jgi:DedD protein
MAERSNATSKKNQDAAQDVSTLQKRGRRRLVGAIALVLLAVIVLPMVFDPEPRQNAPAVSIRIPSEEGTKFTPKTVLKPAAPQPEAAAVASRPAEPAPEPRAATALEKPAAKAEPRTAPPAEKPVTKAEPKAPEKKTPPPAAPPAPTGAGEQFVVQVGAFATPDKIKERVDLIKAAKLPYYSESIAIKDGTVTRIRLGPFDSREAATKAYDVAVARGWKPEKPKLK